MGADTALEAASGLIGSRSLIERVLGPTAEHIGDEIQTLAPNRLHNVKQILGYAHNRIDDGAINEQGVPLRAIKRVLDEGSYCDASLTQAYFGGLLASARMSESGGDRTVPYFSLLEQMSVYEIRAHYLFYTGLRLVATGDYATIRHGKELRNVPIAVSAADFLNCIGASGTKMADTIVQHTLFSLIRHDMAQEPFSVYVDEKSPAPAAFPQIGQPPSVAITPTFPGLELYVYVHGLSSSCITAIQDKRRAFTPPEGTEGPTGAYYCGK